MIKKISITGGIGSGKSTIMRLLANLGYCTWDADIFASEAMAKPAVETQIKALLGDSAYLSPGILNRVWVRERIFLDAALKNGLESILHPVIEQMFTQRVQIMEAQNVSCWVFYEASLIFEKERHTFFDANILIKADDRKRISRVHKHKKWSVEMIQQIIAQQMPTRAKERLADYIVENSSTEEKLEKSVFKLIQYLKKKFQE